MKRNRSLFSVRLRWILFVALAIGTLPAPRADALLTGIGRFDYLVVKAQIIVKARVTLVGDLPPEGPIEFSAEVLSALKTDGQPIPNELHLQVSLGLWAIPYGRGRQAGQCVLLVLQRTPDGLGIRNTLGVVVPASKEKLSYPDETAVDRKVFLELKAVFSELTDNRGRAQLLGLLSDVANSAEKEFFASYLKSSDPWIHRGAMAATARLDPNAANVRAIVEDFKAHLKNPYQSQDDPLFWDLYNDIYWASRCGDFGMEQALTSRAVAYLPIYRVLMDEAPAGYQRVNVGIEALHDVGTREDLARLYRFHNDEKAWIRHEVLEGIGRILNVPVKRPYIMSYGMPLPAGVDAWERTTQADLEQRLKAEGVIAQ